MELSRRIFGVLAITALVAAACGGTVQQSPPATAVASAAPAAPATSAAASAAANADREAPAELIAAARKEGEVVLYSGKAEADLQRLAQAFKAKYGVTVAYKHQASGASLELAAQQLTSGNVLADLVHFTPQPSFQDKWESRFAPVSAAEIPNLTRLPADQRTKTYVATDLSYYGFVYNTNDFKAADLPKDIYGLVGMSKLVNRIGTANPAASNSYTTWHAILFDAWGKEKYEKWVQSVIGDSKARLADSSSTLVNLVASGELSIVGPTNYGQAQPLVAKGAPVAMHYFDPVMSLPNGWVILGGSPHPNAAKLWINWLLSTEGQTLLCGGDRCSSYLDIEGAIKAPQGAKIVQAPVQRGIDIGKSYVVPLVQRLAAK